MNLVTAKGLTKIYGKKVALDRVDFTVGQGRIVGLLGPNGAGKSTALQAMLGLISYAGELNVLGREPWHQRAELMGEACFIADAAVLPGWLTARRALDFMAGLHPRFDRAKAEAFLARTGIERAAKVRTLSKGMIAQLHLALVMAIDARLLVLDEPTLGLDLAYRKRFFDSLLDDYFDQDRTIVVSTHQLDEVQHILTDLILLDRGKVVLDLSMEAFEARFAEVAVPASKLAAARALKPLSERQLLGRASLLFDGADPKRLAALGEVRPASLSEVFLALTDAPAAAPAGEVAA
ncbi:MAG: ABC transporter ATP-binding protein [Proteobacteria bacterium]|nr:ABC transporter ATP-binding protein [Pseudomonadota bacterium]